MVASSGKRGGCVFCAVISGELPAHRVAEDDDHVAFLDRSPVFLGHVLIVPKRRVETLAELDPGEMGPLFEMVRRIADVMPDSFGADGTWMSNNNVISQSVPHVHVHVVPRRKGDGLRGFYWPRQKYADEEQMAETASALAAAIAGRYPAPPPG